MKKFFVILIALALAFSIAGPAAAAADVQGQPVFVNVLIGFSSHPGNSDVALVKAAGGDVKFVYNIIPAIAARLPERAVQALQNNPRITVIEQDVEIYANDYTTELASVWGVGHIGAGTAHADGVTGSGVKVAVIDSGINYNHLQLNANYVSGYDFVNKDDDPMDDNGHGTHVAGTIAAVRDGSSIVGVAPGCSIYALKVLDSTGSGSFSNVIAALDWAVDHDIKVTNNSYGSASDPGTLVKQAFDNAYTAGILHVASAGNSGNKRGTGDSVGYPGKYDSVMAVAAVDSSDVRASWSSTGPAVEISAPGVSIYSTYLNNAYATMSGTSMASPHVAGVAALLFSAGASSNTQVRSLLTQSARNIGIAEWYGSGLVDVPAALALLGYAPEPSIAVTVSTDKGTYERPSDTQANITITVKDETNSPVTGLTDTDFSLTLNSSDISGSVTVIESAVPGTYTAEIGIAGLTDGSYTLSVTAAAGGLSASANTVFTLTTKIVDPVVKQMSVTDISYNVFGNKDRGLKSQITVKDIDGLPVSGAAIKAYLYKNGKIVVTGTGYTDSNGIFVLTYNNAGTGTYTTDVATLEKTGYDWDGKITDPGFIK